MKIIPWDQIKLKNWRLIYSEDDQFKKFEYLKLVQKPDRVNGVHLISPFELKTINNVMRGVLSSKRSGYLPDKLTSLSGLLEPGWSSMSWAIPYIVVENEKNQFDRRHTLKNIIELITAYGYRIPHVYGAEYERVWTDDPDDIINDLSTESITMIAGMWGNNNGPVPADTKDHNFIGLSCYIIKKEEETKFGKGYLTNDETIKDILIAMGAMTRYKRNESFVKNMVTRIRQSLEDVNSKSHLPAINNVGLEDQVKEFMRENSEWGKDNTENDESFFSMRTYTDKTNITNATAEEILAAAVRKEKLNRKHGTDKVTKIMMYDLKDAENTTAIVSARKKLIETLKNRWELKRDSAYIPVYEKLKPGVFEEKTLSDLNFEIWFYPQIQGETEPILQPFI
ncbi:hypothetical protein CPQG_00185 [Cyanophage P-RSM3]|uniref:Uncharacterized protein n=3 Tax=Ronodorvirus ssm4 TaxID=2845939 RepID=M1Q6J5_9CAUD|nr:hypothetical protein PSSM4_109 [Prochlorococcus phage P-SSM4]AAX46910.1 hypothetical protein PSSM4_109 [Prochlorococcus phage P-SSM4]AGF91483.1 hypothetical protein CPYG_00189 [Cyanophage P-SS1]AGH26711.1 hypothetical protein CPQG_00185 [Cyanophage P-RSM3]